MRLVVAVSDTGIGIPADAMKLLFREFSQVDGSISRRFGGSGLGLAISRRLVERMAGSMTVDSEPGRGSTFRFEILLKDAPMESPRVADQKPSGRCEPLRRLRILLVEDNGTNRLVATRMVERMGHRVDAVADGAEAVEAVRSIPYDLILMDVMMPQMDGLTATRVIRAEHGPVGRTPIIGLTANADRGNEAACREAGMNGFVAKPVTAERLADAIAAAMAAAGSDAAPPDMWPLLDDTVLERLAGDIGEDGVVEVVRLFLAEAPRMVDRLEQGVAQSGQHVVAGGSHAGQCGAQCRVCSVSAIWRPATSRGRWGPVTVLPTGWPDCWCSSARVSRASVNGRRRGRRPGPAKPITPWCSESSAV